MVAQTMSGAYETEVAGVRLRSPMMAIHTVAAGGGSVLAFEGDRYQVGPESAGGLSGTCLLSQWWTANGDRLQRDGGQNSAAVFPKSIWREWTTGAGPRPGAGEVFEAGGKDFSRQLVIRVGQSRWLRVFWRIATDNMAKRHQKNLCTKRLRR